ncbi:hypothetical protein D3C80_2144180 [compost metagenome]
MPRPGEKLKSHILGTVLLHQLNKLLPLRRIEITVECRGRCAYGLFDPREIVEVIKCVLVKLFVSRIRLNE